MERGWNAVSASLAIADDECLHGRRRQGSIGATGQLQRDATAGELTPCPSRPSPRAVLGGAPEGGHDLTESCITVARSRWISLRSKNCLTIELEDESRVRRDVGVWKNQLSSSCRPRASREVIGHARGVAR
eukprot:g43394.t1